MDLNESSSSEEQQSDRISFSGVQQDGSDTLQKSAPLSQVGSLALSNTQSIPVPFAASVPEPAISASSTAPSAAEFIYSTPPVQAAPSASITAPVSIQSVFPLSQPAIPPVDAPALNIGAIDFLTEQHAQVQLQSPQPPIYALFPGIGAPAIQESALKPGPSIPDAIPPIIPAIPGKDFAAAYNDALQQVPGQQYGAKSQKPLRGTYYLPPPAIPTIDGFADAVKLKPRHDCSGMIEKEFNATQVMLDANPTSVAAFSAMYADNRATEVGVKIDEAIACYASLIVQSQIEMILRVLNGDAEITVSKLQKAMQDAGISISDEFSLYCQSLQREL